eukprot:1159660-Pelagomonas_calceolata.AAC.13
MNAAKRSGGNKRLKTCSAKETRRANIGSSTCRTQAHRHAWMAGGAWGSLHYDDQEKWKLRCTSGWYTPAAAIVE